MFAPEVEQVVALVCAHARLANNLRALLAKRRVLLDMLGQDVLVQDPAVRPCANTRVTVMQHMTGGGPSTSNTCRAGGCGL